MRGGAKVIIEPHRHEGVFIARSKEVRFFVSELCSLYIDGLQ